jgi:hypothetical protein
MRAVRDMVRALLVASSFGAIAASGSGERPYAREMAESLVRSRTAVPSTEPTNLTRLISYGSVSLGKRTGVDLHATGFEQTVAPSDGGTPDTAQFVVKTLAGHTFFIPRGYVSSFLAYPGYVQIHALMPCLQPENAENSREFHNNTWGRKVIATLSSWDSHFPSNEKLLAIHIMNSSKMKSTRPTMKDIDIGPIDVPGTSFILYRDIMLSLDIFVPGGPDPPILLMCNMHSQYVPFPSCSAREKILGSIRLEYQYSRSFIDDDINESTTIDTGIHRLLDSFSKPGLKLTKL